MSAPLSKSALAPQPEPECPKGSPINRVLWAVLPAMLALIVVVLRFFGASWRTALLVALLLACPAVIAMGICWFYRRPCAPPIDNTAGRSHGGNPDI